MDNIIIKRCGREEYEDFLNMVNDAFNYGAENEWFQKNMSHCTPYEKEALDHEIANHFIAVCDGEVIGAVGAYPFDWTVLEDMPDGNKLSIKAFGIGQVSCKKEYRGKSIMSKTLKRAMDEMIADGALVGFLGGDRYRYGNFGYDFAGCDVVFGYSRHRLGQILNTEGLNVKEAGIDDLALLESLYGQMLSYIVRDKRSWEKQLKRQNYAWHLGEKDGKNAYICTSKSNKEVIEAQGAPDVVKALILWHMENNGLDYVNLHSPVPIFSDDALYEALWKSASDVSMRSIDLMAVCSVDKLFTLLTPYIIKQGYEDALSGIAEKDKYELVKKLFGFAAAPLSKDLSAFTGIRPLVVWLSSVDNI